MRGLFLSLGLILSGLSFAQGEASPPPVPAQAASASVPATFVAQGEAVEIQGAGFTITPPQGWEVVRGGTGASLLFQAPKVEPVPGGPVVYQSNMRVMVMNEPKPIDDATKDEFSKIILEKGSALSANYNIRSADKVALQSGTEGFLYYTEFTQGGQPMMQMHILVSSATKHFLMTYTDLATVFEAENSPLLTTAYTSMQSAKVDSKPAERWTQYYMVGGVILAIFVLLVFVRVLRGYNMKRLGDRIESEDGDSSSSRDDDDDDPVSGVAEFKSRVDQHGSEDEDYEMPETREAVRPVPKAKKPSSSAPQTQAPRPQAPAPARSPSPPPASSKPVPRAPAPPPASEFGEDNLEKTTSAGKAAKKPVSEHEDEDHGSWADEPRSDLAAMKPETVTTKKAKPQKVANPAKMKDLKDDDETSDVARLSEILPNTGDTKKKKGLFGWGKGKGEDEGDDEPAPTKKSSKKDEEPPMSEVAGWNLKADSKKSRQEDEDDD